MNKKIKVIFPIVALFFMAGSAQSAQWIPKWKTATPLTSPRTGTALVAVNGYLYVIGGVNGLEFLKNTEYAKINKDGSLGPWKKGPDLNELRGHVGAAYADGSIYIVGGGRGEHGQVLSRTIERARIKDDGSLSPWVLENNGLNMPR